MPVVIAGAILKTIGTVVVVVLALGFVVGIVAGKILSRGE